MNWDDLRVFLSVARAGRVAAAARALGVEHSTVARRIASLEADLGAALFYRTAGGYQLTPEGRAALAGAEAMEESALVLGGRIQEQAGTLAGRVRIAILDELASCWLASHVPAFHARFPRIELQIIAGIPLLDLSRGEAELAIRTPRPRQAGLATVKLATVAAALHASRARLAGKRLRVDDSSRGLDLLVYAPAYQRLQSAAWFQPVLASSTIVLSANSSHALAAAAAAGAGIAVLPRFMPALYPDLVAISDDVSPREDLWLVTHPEFRRDPKVRATADFLRKAAATLR